MERPFQQDFWDVEISNECFLPFKVKTTPKYYEVKVIIFCNFEKYDL